MRKILFLLFLPTLLFASMRLECKVFNGAWKAITRGSVSYPDECYAEKESMAAFSSKLDQVWVLDAEKYYYCEFNAPYMNYICVVNGSDSTSIVPNHIINTYYSLKNSALKIK